MQYLSNTVTIYRWEKDGWWRDYRHDQVEMDQEGYWWELSTNAQVKPHEEEPAEWWAVAMYHEWSAYGGPEEGGWWYSVGELVDHAMIRFFSNYADAEAYHKELWDKADALTKELRKEGNCETRYIVMGLTEEMPPVSYPKRRPYYS